MLERFSSYRPVLTAFREADPATIIHEKGHEWLEQLLTFASHEKAPEPLRTPDAPSAEVESESSTDALPAFLADGEDDAAGDAAASDPEEPHAVAAE